MKAKKYIPLPEAAALLAGFQRRDAALVAKADAAMKARGIIVRLFPEKRAPRSARLLVMPGGLPNES